MTNTSASKNKSFNAWGQIIGLAVAVMFVSHAATAAQAPVALGSASTFAVLAGSTVTSTGGTTVNGNLGISPGTALTGAPTVNGTTHLGDPTSAQAQLDLTTAYNDAAGRTIDAITVAGNLGGQTLAPGLYKSTSSLEISSGDLTLDAQGDTNAVWIFQMASTLTTTTARQVILSGGAQAANIFWQVGSSATLGTTSVFKGNILALTSITVTTGAAVEGRLLARNGAVTLDSNTIGLGSPADTTPPTVSYTDPTNAATGVAVNQQIAATFSEAMDPATISTTNFTLTQGPTPVAGTVTYVGTTATFAPTSALASNTTYTATMTTGVKDLAGNALASNFAWSFTTAAGTAGQTPVALGSASTFAVLAASTVTSIAPTTINGDLGLSPGTSVTGSPTVNGTLHVADAAAAQAQLDLTTAYNDAAGRTVGAITLAGNLGGQTLAPGLYKSTSSLEISSGDLTLDAQGDANAVFIFQIASTLTTTVSRQVILSGGAQAANVFWQVGSSATLGTTSVFKGNILALTSITVTTGAAVEGRLLARNGAITLDANTVGLGIPADTTRPTVSSTDPANAATGVAINKKIAVTFSEAMNPSTISTTNFTLTQGTTPVAGAVTYVGTTATFTPASALTNATTYNVAITTGVKDLAGNALAANFSWNFTTGATPDTTRPTVIATVPANAASGVAINHTVTAAFSEAMDPLTISSATFTLKQGTTAVAGTVSYAGVTATFTPAGALAPLTTYTAKITTGVRDLAGNALATDFGWSFTTGATPDTTRPTVSATVPANAAAAVPINQTINATFSEAMDPLTINTASLRLIGPGGTLVTGTVAYDVPSRIASLNPLSNLAANAVYTATITGARDLAGNALAVNFVWSFTTAASAAGQAPVALGSASTFAVLAASTVTSTGATTVNGDLGLSPGTAVTGAPTVNGTIHIADAAAAQAQLDLTAAYNDAAGRTAGAITVAGNLGGQTLTPGLYKSTSSLAISSGDLTLDAQGDVNAVFIFQMGSTLTTTVARQVILSGGARAANVFWQVGSSATIGTGSVFKGNILAMASITVTTGAAVEGRLLARTAAVTLDSNIVGLAIPADATAPTVSATYPANGATGVPLSGQIAATFSEVMEPETISIPTFVLKRGTTVLAGPVTYDGVTAIKAFTSSAGPAPVALGSASTFAVLAASTVTSIAPTTINGDLGLSPGTSVTGSPTVTNGTIHIADAAAAQAQLDLTTAYNDAAGRTVGAITLAGNLGGQTLTPGLYKSTSSLEISSGDLTLDAQGDANAVFIFQMGSTLTTTVGRQVILSGGARAANVFWQVGSSATLGTGSVFKGNILAMASITVTTGAAVEGRLLARTAAVTLDSNTIALPITSPPPPSIGPAPVALGAASTFAVLGASTVTSTGATTVNGDLGLSPGTAVTGFPPGTVNGSNHIADATAAQAQADLTIAYNDAAGRTEGAITLAGNLGGQTLTPGLYKSTSSLEISSGDLTLDAQGDPNGVFIFQMGSTLTTTVGRQVILAGGAQAANVFWQVGSSATLGTGSVFKGNILALASITVTTGATVEGRLLARTAAVTLDSNDIRLPISTLAPLTTYTATITTAARDLAGNPLSTDFSWTFTTGATLDTTRPIVTATVPANAATGVAISAKISLAFSEAMDPLTISSATFTFKQGTTAVAGTVSYAGITATFTPASALAPLTTYTAKMTTGARDLAGNAPAADFSWSFTTGATLDTIAPTVGVTVPTDAATAAPINQTINATFSEAMDPLTINTASLRLIGPGGTLVTATVNYDLSSRIATLSPLSNLAPNAGYVATISTEARDLAGNALAANFVWSFTTAATTAGQTPVALGSASTFAVLAASTVTSTGATTVNGDLGLSPGTAVTGFPPGGINGTVHVADAAAAQAQLDLTAAYNDAAGRTAGAITVAGNLGGQTLTPGLYKSTSSLAISSGDLTLDAQGDVNAVFIFQMGSTLTTTVARQVILSGGARAANVFWQVGSSATIGTGSVFKGNILAMASITVTTGAAVEGRLLARTAAVTLDSNVVGLAIPTDATAPTVSATYPANGATGVPLSGQIAATFSEVMEPETISIPTFVLKRGTTVLAGPVTYDGVTAIKAFTSSAGPAPVALGSASTFAVLAASTVTSIAPTTINGDLGLSPGTSVTGSPTVTNGTIHIADAAAAQAQLDLTTAYNDAAGRTVGAITLAGNLGGQTLTPGLYKSTSSLEISSGDLTLDAQGDANAVFIFQMGSTLTTTVGRQVILSGGARAANVFWQVGSSATLGTGSVFKGNILAMASITVTTGAAVEGRLLARTAAVTLDSNTIALPITSPPPPSIGPAPVALGAASTFAVLGASTVTSTGATTVNGDLGLSPGTAVTGFPPGTVNGSNHIADATAAQAQADLTIAYNDAAGRTEGAITLAGNLGGQTLTPGLYKSTSSLEISSGDLTLDAQGDPNGVFIFQMGSTLTTTVGRQVILAGGAQAANVFWQVGSSATLGTGSVFKGNILALASITVTTGATVEGRLLARTAAVTLDSNDIRLPISTLAPLTTYTATITTAARDLAGNPLSTDFSWTFTTGATLDTTRPIVTATVPANAATGVAISAKISLAFSEAMDPLTISSATFTFKQGTTAVAGTVSYAGITATFTPASALAPLTTYTAKMTTGARDLAGNAPAADFSWSFTTSATLDTTRPTVSVTVPADAAAAVPINQTINATFSEAMDPLTINTASLRLIGPGGTVLGTIAYDVINRIATLNPLSNLAPNAVYTATISTEARDLAGNALAVNFVWSFTTAATTAGQAPVALGSAGTFAVLAASTVTSTGATRVNGDLGLSPGTAVTGFPPGIVNGTIHIADAAAAQAQLDLTTAYNDAAGRTNGAIAVAGNLGGQTLTPGLYKSTSSLAIDSGDLTLDAQGDVNAVFIFQMGSTLTTTVGRQVILSGGARAANVFWQVGSSATIGTGSVFKGNILAMASITATTGAIVEGRLLARTAAVTLDFNVIGVIPAGTVPNTTSVTLQSAATVTGPYTDTTGQSLDLGLKTISAPLSGSMQFYRIRAGTAITIKSITVSGGNVVITYN